MPHASLQEVHAPEPATAVVVDMRNFTSHLNAAETDAKGVNRFYRFLSRFYGLCLDAGMLAIGPKERGRPPLSITSTGDGMLAVFRSPERHVEHAFLATLVLHSLLDRICRGYNEDTSRSGLPETGYGIGVETGLVTRVQAAARNEEGGPVVDTLLGDCINVAARAQALSKELHQAHVIVSERANILLCERLCGENYAALMRESSVTSLPDADRLAHLNRMGALNRALCLSFIHVHQIRGVPRPLALFRVSESSARLGNPRFEALLDKLTHGDAAHRREIEATLAAREL